MKANKKKKKSQLDLLKEIRKPIPPATKVERPDKGGGYKRRKKHKSFEQDHADDGLDSDGSPHW